MSDVQKSVAVIRDLLRIYGARRQKLTRFEQELRLSTMEEIATALRRRGIAQPDSADLGDDPHFELRLIAAEIAKRSKAIQKRMIDALPAAVRNDVLERMYTFSDIVRLDDVSLQLLVRAVDVRIVAVSLIGADKLLVDRIFRNINARAAGIFRQEMEYALARESTDVALARNQMGQALRELIENGTIVMR